jgi:hypothetical protein
MFARLTALLLLSACLRAESLTFVLTETILDVYPGFKDRMTQVLEPLEHDVTIDVLPGERAYKLLLEGQVAGDLFRSSTIIHDFMPVTLVEPPLVTQIFNLIAPSEDPERCLTAKADYKDHSVGGISRAKVNQQLIFPMFKAGHEFESITQAEKMLMTDRVDFLVWPYSEDLKNQLAESLILCDIKPMAEIKVYTVLHDSYAWLLPELEAIYEENF